MASAASVSTKPSTRVQWMWNSSADPFSKSIPANWCPYSDLENMTIEEAFSAGKNHVILEKHSIDFKHKIQIATSDSNRQRPIKRMVCGRDDKRLRKERFLPNPVAPDRPFGDQYGFISPFIKEVVKNLDLNNKKLPSKDETIVPMIVEKAALGIIEEGKLIDEQWEAEKIANKLMEKKNAEMKEVWECCAHLYTLESFLYKKINEIMRLIGSEQHEQVWRSKTRTLGPFCLLLWDNPFNRQPAEPETLLYRGAMLSEQLINSFKNDCSKDPKPWHSFQAFTSCTRNPNVAEQFGNVLFIMKVQLAFTVDLSEQSGFADEEEDLLFPGVSFTIDKVEFDKKKKKHLIYLTLQQRHNRMNLPQDQILPNIDPDPADAALILNGADAISDFDPADRLAVLLGMTRLSEAGVGDDPVTRNYFVALITADANARRCAVSNFLAHIDHIAGDAQASRIDEIHAVVNSCDTLDGYDGDWK